MSASGNLTRAVVIVEEVLSLIHGTWMATGAIEGVAERDAIRTLTHTAGERLDEVRAILMKLEAGDAAPLRMVGGERDDRRL